MKKELTFQTRREFLRHAVLGGALTWTVPAFLAHTFAALAAQGTGRGVQAATGRDGTILVVLQMAGGNDGLNTVVPYANDEYHRARPRLGLAGDKVLKLTDELGLNPALVGFKALYDGGQLAIVQGVGYPNPNRSHFRSTEIWQTASEANRYERYGWIGRYFDAACGGGDADVGVSVGRQMPQAFRAKRPKGISLDNPQTYRFMTSGRPRPGQKDALEESFRKLNQVDEATAEHPGDALAAIGGAGPVDGSALDFVERTALEAQVSSDRIRAIAGRGTNQAAYPASNLGNSLRLVARLIGGGMPTRVYYVSQGGYDTHTNQLAAQERLLKDLSDSVQAFVKDLKAQGQLARVLLMTFSEFGRRVAENASGGTDHGAAAPLFVVGERVKAGLVGRHPSLAPDQLFRGDLKHTLDFRSVYATLLEDWLATPSLPVLGKAFPKIGLV